MLETPGTLQRIFRTPISLEWVLLICAIYCVASFNGPYWALVMQKRDWGLQSTAFFTCHVLGLVAVMYLLFAALTPRILAKPVLMVLLLASSAGAFYMDRYKVYLDPTMLRNVLQTNPKEASELISFALVKAIFIFGLLPCLLLYMLRIKSRPWIRSIGVRLGSALLALAVLVGAVLTSSKELIPFHRNQKEARYLITPANLAYGVARNLHTGVNAENIIRQPIGQDAVAQPAWATRSKPPLIVLVLGETARAANFQLNGYARATNPALLQRGVINFPSVSSCGTATAVSLPCMFSQFSRADYTDKRGLAYESVLHVLARSGAHVVWRDNQSGCKGVCTGLEVHDMTKQTVPQICANGVCFDEILLHEFDAITAKPRPLVVVLHQLGSHGPAYYARYPKAFEKFTPVCASADLRQCERESIVNAYDNSLLYADHLLGKVIDKLAADQRYDSAMIYVSDHGESLGENGLYLHGMPYSIAPKVQTHVPMVMWFSPSFGANTGLNLECLKRDAGKDYSHDNLFHSLLGLLQVSTTVYDPKLDLFKPCR
jgi:lipid A ethanolaminephosphotransferase